MKTKWLSLLIVGITTLWLNACNKDNDTDGFTAADAADIVAGALKSSSNGLDANLTDAGIWLEEGNGKTLAQTEWDCNFSGDSTFVATKTVTGNTYTYNMNYVYYTTCNVLNLPTQFNINLLANGIYENNRVESADTSNIGLEFTDLLPPATEYTLNGIITRNGNQTHKIASKELKSLLVITLSDITLNKTDYTISGGSGFVTLTINLAGNIILYSGNLTFNGNGSVTFVLNGNSYTVDLNG